MNMNMWKAVYYLFFAATVMGVVTAGNTAGNTLTAGNNLTAVSSAFCSLVRTVKSIIALFAVIMFLIGGVLYAVGHFLPLAGNLKSSVQGWALGIILGGIVGVILVIIAQPIVNMVATFGNGLTSVSC